MGSLSEFELIQRYFVRECAFSTNIQLGIGDDCALLHPSEGMSLAVSTDMLVEGRHFLSTIAPDRLGHKALAVNLSDLAAMGAKPMAFTLSVSMPAVNEKWCERFAKGLFALADHHQCALIGGDTTAGPLSISITVFGQTTAISALRRNGAQVGDDIYISHPHHEGIGAPRLLYEALCHRATLPHDSFELAMQRMELPEPRVGLGMALQGVASSTIDLSDGLLGDLEHILKASHVGARIEADMIPKSSVLHHQPIALQRLCTLSGGDDYELLFTAPRSKRAQVLAAAHQNQIGVTPIGIIEAQHGVRLYDARGQHVPQIYQSFDHFQN